jgi:phage terminase small subunit
MLTRKQKRAVDALAQSPTITQAAENAGCARRSIHDWLKETEFRNALLARERELRIDAARMAAIYSVEAIQLLHEIFTNERNDVSVRRLAAKDLLAYLNATDAMLDLELRITKLEAKR